jgi:hypothetical protein
MSHAPAIQIWQKAIPHIPANVCSELRWDATHSSNLRSATIEDAGDDSGNDQLSTCARATSGYKPDLATTLSRRFIQPQRPAMRLPSNHPTAATARATCAGASQDKLSVMVSKITASDFLANIRCYKKRQRVQALGRVTMDDQRDQSSKRPCLAGPSTRVRDHDGNLALACTTASMRRGHSYREMRIGGHSRVHMGDNYGGPTFNIRNSLDLWTAMDTQRFADAETRERAIIVQLAISILAAALMHAFMHCLLRLTGGAQRRVPSLLNLIGSRIAVFEDALGEIKHIDIDVVTDWTTFHYNLACTFKYRPGYCRIAAAGYRLFDRAQSNQLIDPKHPPAFTDIFHSKAYVLMSVHFEWEEVPLECCPRCGLEQEYEPAAETTCKNKGCGFRYRGQVEERRIEESNDRTESEEYTPEHDERGPPKDARKKLLKYEQVHPAQFSRISVSKQLPVPDTDGATTMPSTPAQDFSEPDSQTVSMGNDHLPIVTPATADVSSGMHSQPIAVPVVSNQIMKIPSLYFTCTDCNRCYSHKKTLKRHQRSPRHELNKRNRSTNV